MGVIGVPPHANNTHKTQFIDYSILQPLFFGDGNRNDLIQRFGCNPLLGINCVQTGDHIHAFDHFTENSIATVQSSLGSIGDKELATIGVGAGIGNTENTFGVEFQIRDFISIFIPRTTHTQASWVTYLSHKARNHAMEFNIIIETFCCQKNKAVDCQWSFLGVKFDF